MVKTETGPGKDTGRDLCLAPSSLLTETEVVESFGSLLCLSVSESPGMSFVRNEKKAVIQL